MTPGARCPTCGHVAEPAALTTRQREVLLFIQACVALTGVAPTQETMRVALKLRSPGTLAEHLAKLERKGYLRRDHNRRQGITLLVSVPS